MKDKDLMQILNQSRLDEIKNDNFNIHYKNRNTKLFTLKNGNGVSIQLTNYGAKIASIYAPDRNGNISDIILGYDSIIEYIEGNPYFGAICGRFANRIANGKFSIEGKEYRLPINNGTNHLHGGPEGFNTQMFDIGSSGTTDTEEFIEMSYVSPNGDMGYPGNLILRVKYSLNHKNEFKIEYEATTDRSTHVNICSHAFFNLAGEGKGNILNHELKINAELYTPVNEYQIPTGEFSSVKGTPMDFTHLTPVGERINAGFEQLALGNGYDHNWVLNKKIHEMGLAAVCHDPESGRIMEVFTTQPGIQFYTGNWLDGSDKGKNGEKYERRSALCLEAQHFPDSPNHPDFPSTLLRPGEVYKQTCIYKFSAI